MTSALQTTPLFFAAGVNPENTLPKQPAAAGAHPFGPLLEQAVAALGRQSGGDTGMPDTQQLVNQLQSLPQPGKLLPLLEQVIDGAVAAGGEADQVLEQLAATLEAVEDTTDLNPQQAMAVALFQLIEANPEYLGSVAVPAGVVASHPGSAALLLRNFNPDAAGEAIHNPPGDSVDRAPKSPALDKVIELLHQKSSGPGPLQAENSGALEALRRITAEHSAASPAAIVRTEAVLAAVAPVQQASVNPAASSVPAAVGVESRVGDAGWDQALGERVQWLMSKGAQSAQIRLNPAHLGPMEIRIVVQNDQAQVQFTSAHAVVRDAVEAALPRLREMLGASGVELVNVDVSSGQSFAGQQRTGDQDASVGWLAGNALDGGESGEPVVETPLASLLEAGRLDLFA